MCHQLARPRSRLVSSLILVIAGGLGGCVEQSGEPVLPDPPLQQAIINGKPCSAAEHPSTVALILDAKISYRGMDMQLRTLMCTGTLIAPDVVLSAAHCSGFGAAIGMPITDETYYVSFTPDLTALAGEPGSTPVALPADAVKVKRSIAHPDFSLEGGEPVGLGNLHDVAVFFLSTPVPVGQVKPAIVITKAEASQIVEKKATEISGWGARDAAASQAGLKFCATSFINQVATHEMQIGAGPETSRKCHGDSGGPSYIDITGSGNARRLVGITSRAWDETDCQKGGIDTRVDAWLDWIDQQMRDGCTTKQRAWCDVTGIIPPEYYQSKPDARSHEVREAGPASRDLALASEPDGQPAAPSKSSGCALVSTVPQAPAWPIILVAVLILGKARVRRHRSARQGMCTVSAR